MNQSLKTLDELAGMAEKDLTKLAISIYHAVAINGVDEAKSTLLNALLAARKDEAEKCKLLCESDDVGLDWSSCSTEISFRISQLSAALKDGGGSQMKQTRQPALAATHG